MVILQKTTGIKSSWQVIFDDFYAELKAVLETMENNFVTIRKTVQES